MAQQAEATKALLAATRERKRQEQDPLFIASQLYSETKAAAEKLSGPRVARKTKEERAALRTQLYAAVQSQEEERLQREEEEAGKAMREALVLQAQIGRPADWHPDLGHSLCAWVADGRPLRSWCRQTGIAMQTVYTWMARDPVFEERYRLARESYGVEALVDDMLRLPDEAADRANMTMPQAKVLELQISVRQWLASKLLPKRYGDKSDQSTAQGVININIGIPQKESAVVEQVDATAVKLSA